MTATVLLCTGLLLPWLLATLLAFKPSRGLAQRLAPLAPWPVFAVLLLEVAGAGSSAVLGPLAFTSSHHALALALAGTGFWALLVPYAVGWARGTGMQTALLLGWLLATLGANLIALLAADMLTFYVGFALSSFAAWGLILLGEGTQVRRAARVYMVMMLLAELGLLVGLAAIANTGDFSFGAASDGRLQGVPLLLFAAGCAIKLGLVGAHVWLPLAHGSAPVPASALLSGLLVKLGLLAWWHVAGDLRLPQPGFWLLCLGLAGAFYGVTMGLLQTYPKRILAFSTVSQIGLLAAGLGAIMQQTATDTSVAALTDLAVHHMLHKSLAFLALGLLLSRSARIRQLGIAALAWVLLSLAAAPFTSGAGAKLQLETLLIETEQAGLLTALNLSSFATALLLGHLGRQAWTSMYCAADRHLWVPVQQWLPVTVLLGVCASLPLFSQSGWYAGLVWPLLGAIPGWFWNARAHLSFAPAAARWPRLGVRLERHLQRWELMGRCLLLLVGLLLATLWLSNGYWPAQ